MGRRWSRTTNQYIINDGQVQFPATVHELEGIQPEVNLKLDRNKRAGIAINEEVTLPAIVDLLENTGKIVSVE
ncbi:hypothetical protein [Chondrinema litorale]|uniref:hypothetical protein n=1 Tax=Chondrinema litorale TaxID=2994555 RepID=UPI0025438B72|nr:hypothetical protein [Chondrinema litorale]UZR97128.1 hypothetical protein OQ292_23815 [Chondrinema litorale]